MEKLYAWLKHNWQLKLISLFIAILLWWYTAVIQSPQVTEVFLVPVHYYGLRNHLLLDKWDGFVSVYLKGPEKIIEHVTPDELNVFVDLSDIEKAGEYTFRIDASIPGGLNLVKVKPKALRLKIFNASVKFFLLKPTFIGNKIKTYKIDFRPNLVKLKGSESDISKIKYVTIFLVDEILKSYKNKNKFLKIMRVYPITSSGEILDNITLEPKIVEVSFKKQ